MRIPQAVARQIRVEEGDAVQLRVDADELEIRPARPRYRLNALVRGMTPQNRHADTDWGTAQGREVW